MKKLLKILLVVIVLLIGAGVGVGFVHDPKFDQREVVIVNAPVEKVYALVGDPKNVASWLPKDAGDIDTVEVNGKAVASGTIVTVSEVQLIGKSATTDALVWTHKYHLKNGKYMQMCTVSQKKDEEYLEKMVGGDSGFERMVSDITWGFDMAPADGDKTKTKLTVVSRGEATKPLGNVIFTVGEAMGLPKKHAQEMAANIEKALAAAPAAATGTAAPAGK